MYLYVRLMALPFLFIPKAKTSYDRCYQQINKQAKNNIYEHFVMFNSVPSAMTCLIN